MSSSQEQAQDLYEIALSIGGSLDLQEMLGRSTQTMIRKLGCLRAVVLADRRDGERCWLEEVFTSPPDGHCDSAVDASIEELPAVDAPGSGRTRWSAPEVRRAGDAYLHALDLAGFGVLVLVRENPLDGLLARSLQPICDRLGESCRACESATGLAQNRERLRDVQRLAHMGHWDWDVQTGEVQWSDELYRLFGVDRKTFRPDIESVLARFHPDDRHVREELIARSLTAREERHVEFRILRPDGSIRHAVSTFEGLFDREGLLRRLTGIIQDITERKLTEARLRESEEKYRLLFDSADVLVSVYDRDGVCQLMNRKVAALFGGRPQDVAGKSLQDLYPEVAAEYARRIALAIDTRTACEYEDELTFPGGRRWLVSWVHPVADAQGDVGTAQVISQDITERKQAEHALRSEKELSETFINSLPGLFYVVSDEQKFVRWNRNWERVTGYSAEEMGVRRATDFFEGADREHIEERISKVLSEGVAEAEADLVTKDGRRIPYYFTGVRQVFDGRLCFIGLGIDITARKRAQQQFETIFEMSLDLVCIADINTATFVKVNPAFTRVLGYSEEELVGRSFLDHIHPDDVQVTIDLVERELRRGAKVLRFENRYLTKKGGYRWLSWTSNPVAEEGLTYAIARDVTERKEAEQALRESEERYRNFVSHASEGIYRIDLAVPIAVGMPDQELVAAISKHALVGEANEALAGMYGLRPEDMVGRPATDFAPDYGDRALLAVRSPQLQVWEVETQDVDKDGRLVHLSESFSAVVENGILVRIWGMQRDITERKRAEEALRQNEEKLSSIFRAAPIGIGLVRDRRFVDVNERVCEMLGHSREELIGGGARLCYPADEDYELVGREVYRQIEEHGTGTVETHWQHRSGEVIDVLLSATPLDFGDPTVGLSFAALDITDRKRTEEALRLTQFAVDHSSIGIFFVGSDARILSVNEHGCRSLGYTAEELCRMTVFDIDPTLDRRRWIEHRGRVRANASSTIETLHRRKDGTTIPVEVTVDQACFAGHEFTVSFVRDISERKQAEAERRELEAQLRQSQKLEAVGLLAGGVAHDFNNLLTAIIGNVELSMDSVQSELGADHSVIESMAQIERAAQRASALTRQLLTFSRRDVMQPRALNLNQILTDLDKMLRRLITENIMLETVTDPALKPVRADAGHVEQVIVNLVVNAVQAMPDGGHLTLETQSVSLDEEYVRSHAEARPGPHVLLAISDTGHGMDAATRERIFEPFFTTKSIDQGSGLGLATVHGIVQQAGGHIMVYSEPGRGTTFRVYLPAIEAAHDDQMPVTDSAESLRGNETVLLCEDDRPVCELIAESLRSVGYTVLTAGSGQQGIAAAQAHAGPIGLLITDVIMPDMNGRILAEHLKSQCPDLPTLFISGYTSNVIAHHGVLDEGVEFLEKPFTRLRLLTKVRAVLSRSRDRAR